MDRWLEIDIDWFGPPPCGDRIDEFCERVAPLLSTVTGDRGIILNVGWLADIITEWTGDDTQVIPLRSRRYERWGSTTYGDLRAFVADLRAGLVARGVEHPLIGVFIAALGSVVWPRDTGTLYDLYSDWSQRHPELYPLDISRLPGPDLDPRVPLHADTYPYASHPGGIEEGTTFARLLADQWGALSVSLGLDVIHLRDGFWGPMLYSRKGPYGVTASPDPAENQSWTDAVIELVREVKLANTGALVMAYSSAVSQTAEWRVGCVDMEAVVADGHLDIWIDQTWGGAWQDWWDDHWKGWTFQFANLLGHGVPLRQANRRRKTPCRHYKLIETWDGWEPWDTIHRTPGKLEWAMWAFSHATVLDGDRLRVPEGGYISWMNDWTLALVSGDDVAFLATALDAAEASAGSLEEVYGPLLVIDRAGPAALHDSTPQQNGSEWIEDQAAMLLKGAWPLIAAAAPGDVPDDWPEGMLVQIPGALAPAGEGSGARVVSGRADLVSDDTRGIAGVRPGPMLRDGYFRDLPTSADLPVGDSVHLAGHPSIALEDGVETVYSADGVALLAGRDRTWLWQPPDLHEPGNPLFPRNQLGTINPYLEVSRLMARQSRGLSADPTALEKPVTVQAWRSGGRVFLLAGNLETGWIGDSRTPRDVTVRLPHSRLPFPANTATARLEPTVTGGGAVTLERHSDHLVVTLSIAPSGVTLATIGEKDS
ncbi:hypothetical protein BH10ACT7_BH10ACT7_26980 [soil metagenome]